MALSRVVSEIFDL